MHYKAERVRHMRDHVLFVPVMMCDHRLFEPQILSLAHEYTTDVAKICNAETITQMAGDILAQAPDVFALVGLSMGGIVAMEMLRLAPQRISRIALLDTNPLAETHAVSDAREPQIARVRAGGLKDVMQQEMKPNYLAPGRQRHAILSLVQDMALALGPQVFIRQSKALQQRRDQQSVLRDCQVPALVMCGAHDRLCSVSRHRLMADLLPNSELKVIADAGHFPSLETPQETSQALIRWLQA